MRTIFLFFITLFLSCGETSNDSPSAPLPSNLTNEAPSSKNPELPLEPKCPDLERTDAPDEHPFPSHRSDDALTVEEPDSGENFEEVVAEINSQDHNATPSTEIPGPNWDPIPFYARRPNNLIFNSKDVEEIREHLSEVCQDLFQGEYLSDPKETYPLSFTKIGFGLCYPSQVELVDGQRVPVYVDVDAKSKKARLEASVAVSSYCSRHFRSGNLQGNVDSDSLLVLELPAKQIMRGMAECVIAPTIDSESQMNDPSMAKTGNPPKTASTLSDSDRGN